MINADEKARRHTHHLIDNLERKIDVQNWILRNRYGYSDIQITRLYQSMFQTFSLTSNPDEHPSIWLAFCKYRYAQLKLLIRIEENG